MSDYRDYFLQEYQALRNEKLQRYEYASKLNERLITSSIAIWTIAFAIFAAFGSRDFDDSVEGPFIIGLECLQVVLLMIPSYISIFIFKASQNNSIRIHLISDYLRMQAQAIDSSGLKTWEIMKKTPGKEMFYFYDLDLIDTKDVTDIKNIKTGELTRTHFFISWFSMLLSCTMLCGISRNCLPYLFHSDLIDISKVLCLATIIPFCLVCILHMCISCCSITSESNRKRRALYKSKCFICILSAILVGIGICICVQLFPDMFLPTDKDATIYYYLITYIFVMISILLVPCYGLRQKLVDEVIKENAKTVNAYWSNEA